MTVDKIHRPSAGVNVIWKDQASSSLPLSCGQSFNSLLVFQVPRAEQDWCGCGAQHFHIPTSLNPCTLPSSCPTASLPKPDKGEPREKDLGGESQASQSSGGCQGEEDFVGGFRRWQHVSLHGQVSKTKQNYTSVYVGSKPKNKVEMTKLTSK